MYKMPEPIEIKNKIKKIGEEKNLSMKDIAEKAQIDFSTIYGWSTYMPTLYNLICVANALDCTIDDLIEVKEDGD